MSRTVPAPLQTHLNGSVLTLAICVKVTRADGTVYGFTSNDQDVVFGGVTYEAASAVDASMLRGQSQNGGLDNMDVIGLLQSSRITDADLMAGRYDGATLEVFVVNYAEGPPVVSRAILMTGTMGEIGFQDGQYRAEFRPLGQRLKQQIGELTSPLCRVADLGDSRCAPGGLFDDGHALSFYQRASKSVSAVTDRANFTVGSVSDATGFFTYGRIQFTSGANNGIAREIKSHVLSGGAAVLVLQEPFPFTVAVSDVCTLTAGCDRKHTTCQTKFANIANNRSEPYTPGTDRALKRGRK